MMRLVTKRLTKIINIPNMKDHGATGVTGCLKNIAYGSFSNVARTHQRGKSHTYSVVGTLATIEPLRSRTVLQIMDGLRGVWHGGPFARTTRYVFYPRQIMFGTDPVAIDRLLLDIIDNKRKAEGAISIWDRSPSSLKMDDTRARDADPNVNIIIREPGHVEYARLARPRRLRSREDHGAGRHGMRILASSSPSSRPSSVFKASRHRPIVPVRVLGAGCRHRAAARRCGITHICVPPEQVDAWRAAGVDARGRQLTQSSRRAKSCRLQASLRAPGSRRRRGRPGLWPTAGVSCAARQRSSSTTCRPARPRWPRRRPSPTAADAVIKIDPADLESLGSMLTFLRGAPRRRSAVGRGFRGRGRWVARDGRGHEPARPPEPAVRGRESAVSASTRSTSRSAAPTTRRRRPPTRAPSHRRSGSASATTAAACGSTAARSSSDG